MFKEISGLPVRQAGILALLGATLFWGAGPVVVKLAILEIPPYMFAFLRMTLAFLILLPFFIKSNQKIDKLDLGKLLMVGVFGAGISSIFFMSGIVRTEASTSAAIFATVPLVNAIAAYFILKEKLVWVRGIGVAIGLIGSLVLVRGSLNVLGDILILGAVFSWVAYIILSKELLKKYSPLTITTLSFLVGMVMIFPLSLFEFINNPAWYENLTALGIFTIVYGAIFMSVAASLLFQFGVKYTSAFEAGIVTYLNPVLTTIFAIPFLGEHPTPLFLLGTGLILGGVFLATTYELIKKRRNT